MGQHLSHQCRRWRSRMALVSACAANHWTRRWFFTECGVGLGAIALADLLRAEGLASTTLSDPMAPRKPHFPAKAKRVVFLFMAGAPSHLELFDYKPTLAKLD